MLGMDYPDRQRTAVIAVPIRERLLEAPGHGARRPRQVDHHLVGSDRLGGDQRTVDEEMRAVLGQDAVLGGERLAFRGVDDHDRRSAEIGKSAYGPPFAVRGKPRPAPAAKPATLDDVEQPFAADGAAAEPGSVLCEALGTAVQGGAREQPRIGRGRAERRWYRRGADQRCLGHSGPEVTMRPLIDGPVPYSVITRRVVPQTA